MISALDCWSSFSNRESAALTKWISLSGTPNSKQALIASDSLSFAKVFGGWDLELGWEAEPLVKKTTVTEEPASLSMAINPPQPKLSSSGWGRALTDFQYRQKDVSRSCRAHPKSWRKTFFYSLFCVGFGKYPSRFA